MSAGAFEDYPLTDHKDSVLYMMMRRLINGEYAQDPIDFNVVGLRAGEQLSRDHLTPRDIIADIGSSSGKMIAEAALAINTQAQIICLEPDKEAVDAYLRLPDEQRQRITFVRAAGETVPLRDNAVQGATLHNVIFRAQDDKAMLREVKRIVAPDGFVAISSNAKGHAYYRHEFERFVAKKVMQITDVSFTVPPPPADGHYLEDLPKLIRSVGDLEIRDDLYVSQDTQAVITRGERLENYLDSIKYSAANTNLPAVYRSQWRSVVDIWIKPYIETEIDKVEQTYKELGLTAEPFFADPIQRGMFVLQNKKKH